MSSSPRPADRCASRSGPTLGHAAAFSAARDARKGEIMKLARDTWLLFQRQFSLVLRNPVWIVVGIIQPLYYLFLFGPLLKKALQAQSNGQLSSGDAYRFFVPGVLVQLAIFATFFVGFALISELRAGVIERTRVTPVSRLAMLLGRSLRDVVTLLFQCALITVLSIPLGLTGQLGDILLAFALLALIALMLSSLSYAVALKLRSEDALAPLLNTVGVPILLLSGILLPLTYAPHWLQNTAKFNPFSWAVDGARALFNGNPADPNVWKSLVILGVLTVLSVVWAARSFAKSVR
jgi:ABC-2 type transport system permease protein